MTSAPLVERVWSSVTRLRVPQCVHAVTECLRAHHRVDALTLTQVLAQKKNADLDNKEVIIKAKADKQTKIIESEGLRAHLPCDAHRGAPFVVPLSPNPAPSPRSSAPPSPPSTARQHPRSAAWHGAPIVARDPPLVTPPQGSETAW